MRTTSIFQWPSDLLTGIWRLADPKIALASLVPFATGVALAMDQRGTIDWSLAIAAFIAIFLVEVGKNAVNDLYDFRSGADTAVLPEERSPFSGGKRVLVDGLLSEHDCIFIAWLAFGVAGLIGLEIASRSQPALLLLGAIAALISIYYAAPPVKLASRGLGELAVFAVYGPGIVIGTLLLLRATITTEAVLAAMALGFLIANVLLMNEIPDMRADRLAGKNTLIVRLGRDRAETLIALVFTAGIGLPVIMAAYGSVPFRLAAFVVAALPASFASVMLSRTPHEPPVAAQTLTLITYVVAGLSYATVVLVL